MIISNVYAVRKKDSDGNWTERRMVHDLKAVNDCIMSDPFPSPVVSDTMQRLGEAKIFSRIGLKSAYWQIPLHPDDCFRVPGRGVFR